MPDIPAHITGTVWKIEVAVGDEVDLDDTVVILESMKMEIPVVTDVPGYVRELHVKPEDVVQEGDLIAIVEES